MSNELIRSHKELNQNIITTENEGTLKIFMCLLGEFNKQKKYNNLVFSKMGLWKLFKKESEYRTKNFENLVRTITKSEIYSFKNKDFISGSMFTIEKIGENIEVEVSNKFRKYLFYKRDIDLMTKAKQKKKMDVAELDYYDREVKPKSKELVLLNKAHILGIKGKYNVRIYTLLKQWDKVGKFEKSWAEFKGLMEFPVSAKTSRIDLYISKFKSELLKANIKITKIEKVKKGRSIDKIRILFKTVDTEKVSSVKVQAKEVVKPVMANEKVEVSREDVISKLVSEHTHLDIINKTLKMFKYEETNIEECLSLINK